MAELSPVKDLFPLGSEWRPWSVWSPPPVLIQIITIIPPPVATWPTYISRPWVGFPSEMESYRERCKGELYWRLTGIGKQTIEGLDR